MDQALVGVIAAAVAIFVFAIIAICFTIYYCNSMLKKKAKVKNIRRPPADYSTVSTVAAGYSSYYPANWYYADPYAQPNHLSLYRPKVLDDENAPHEEEERNRRHRSRSRDEGHNFDGIDYKVIRKSQKRLSDWLDANYDVNTMSMVIGAEEDDDRSESLTAEQFLAQNTRQSTSTSTSNNTNTAQNGGGEFTIIDYVDTNNRKRSRTEPYMFERQPDPVSSASMPYMYKSTIEVVQEKTVNRLESLDSDDNEPYPASTSSPANSNQGASPFKPTKNWQSQNSVGFDYNEENSFEKNYHRQRIARAGSIDEMPPQDPDNYREFMTSQMRNYQ
ncbi:hypothetical protein LOTGIDRAFT_156424 [Lottia gigantea]|uniref:Uncharacterized protein n=1 Tax=Lottia gigantea TaxID=225164 RepID=V4CN62_LOTGI|nr:hypothetical protein LOTGIDRAFT_156424 [Lottia gigantea]ESP03825.1 hypothetical protein LOTGIDRAFT_156424 [Lottia gigantea]